MASFSIVSIDTDAELFSTFDMYWRDRPAFSARICWLKPRASRQLRKFLANRCLAVSVVEGMLIKKEHVRFTEVCISTIVDIMPQCEICEGRRGFTWF